MAAKEIPTQETLETFEETRNCYYCEHLIEKESFKDGKYVYKFYCREHRIRLVKMGWCPEFKRREGQ